MSIEERLYNCFKKVFDENNGKLCVPLDGSNIVFEEVVVQNSLMKCLNVG